MSGNNLVLLTSEATEKMVFNAEQRTADVVKGIIGGIANNDIVIGHGPEAVKAQSLLVLGDTRASGFIRDNNGVEESYGPAPRTTDDIVVDFNTNFRFDVTAEKVCEGVIKLTAKTAGSAGNDIIFTCGRTDEGVLRPCLGIGTTKMGSLVPGADAGSQTGFKLVLNGEEVLKNAYSRLDKVADYLFEVWYDSIDYDYAHSYFGKQIPMINGACSAIRKGNFYGRNFDWLYADQVEFIIHTTASCGRNSVVGICGAVPGMTNDKVYGKEYNPTYRILPFMLSDGINEHGLVCNVNVVPALEKGYNDVVHAQVEELDEICSLMIPRYVLDNFETAESAAEYLRDYVTIFQSKQRLDSGYEHHFIIADSSSTYLVEFIDGKTVITEISDKPYMTNFHLTGVNFNSDGTVETPGTSGKPTLVNLITPHGAGLERYNMIVNGYSSIDSVETMQSMLQDLYYSRTYASSASPAEPIWYSEYVGDGLSVDSEPDDFADIIALAAEGYRKRDRKNPILWETTHSIVYDIGTKKGYINIQEDTTKTYEITLDKKVGR